MTDPFFRYFREGEERPSRRLYRASGSPKEYLRFKRTDLPQPSPSSFSLTDALQRRKSTRAFSDASLTLQSLGDLLFWSAGMFPETIGTSGMRRRPHPSGGGKFPLEVYPLVLNCEGIAPGAYHYNPKTHALERLLTDPALPLRELPRLSLFRKAGTILLISFVKGRSVATYGNLAYKLGLLEAGHMGQNVYLLSSALGLGACALGLSDATVLEKAFDFDGANESFCYAVAVGVPAGGASEEEEVA